VAVQLVSCPGDIEIAVSPPFTGRGYSPGRQPGGSTGARIANEVTETAHIVERYIYSIVNRTLRISALIQMRLALDKCYIALTIPFDGARRHMNGLDLRPLSVGEILDRTFSLYRRHFLLFIGIAGIPQLLVLGFSLARTLLPGNLEDVTSTLALSLVYLSVALFAYLYSQGGTLLAVSELYLGRTTTIAGSLRNVSSELAVLFGVILLSGLAVGGAFLLLVVPGIYVACRLMVCVPAVLIENRSPREALSRSFDLTKDHAGRAFVILVLSVVLTYAAQLLLAIPAAVAMAAQVGGSNMTRFWLATTQVGSSIASILVTPILLIATAVFYYDLRVRKEGFDLQFMMDPNAQRVPRSSDIPSIL
jgi:hypothetical protein